MTTTSPEREKAYESFAGFLETYRASNLAHLESAVSGYLSEMRARLRTLTAACSAEPAIKEKLSQIEAVLADVKLDIVERLRGAGSHLLELTVADGSSLCGKGAAVATDFKRVLYLFVTAAEASKSPPLMELAVQIASSFRASTAARSMQRT